MVPTFSYEIPRASHYSGSYHAPSSFIYRTFTFYGMLFQNISTRFLSHFCSPSPQVNYFSWFRLFLFRSPLLQESSFLSFPAGTKMFQFPALAFHIVEWYLFKVPGCPIRKSADQRSFAPTRSLSQLITSFIASESQGIRHVPLLTFCLTDHVWSIYTFSF